MTKIKILVTGGAGFIGGNFIQYLMENYPNYDIYNLDALTYAGELSKHKSIDSRANYRFIHANIIDRETIIALFEKEKFNYVVHFAAESHVDRSIKNPSIFSQTNFNGTQVLLDAALQVGVNKFIHVSTDEVYGELNFEDQNLFNEETPLNPSSPYSASKAASDFIVQAYHKTYGLPVNITRCSNNYGPYQFPEKLIPMAILSALTNRTIPVYGDGRNIRDWLHVYDHCTAIDLIIHQGKNGETYNIGGHNERMNIEVVKSIIHALDKSENLIEFVADRLGHDKRYAIDPKKLEQLGWSPKYTFDNGIMDTIRWYVKFQEWWQPILLRNSVD